MSQLKRMIMAGTPPLAASQVASGPVQTGLTGAGTSSQSAALALGPSSANIFSTVAANSGARLPFASQSGPVLIFNGGVNALLLYPATGETINASTANSSFSVTAAKSVTCVPLNSGWIVNLSA
jgi:hypothetical protein